jgi:hypothetical protein
MSYYGNYELPSGPIEPSSDEDRRFVVFADLALPITAVSIIIAVVLLVWADLLVQFVAEQSANGSLPWTIVSLAGFVNLAVTISVLKNRVFTGEGVVQVIQLGILLSCFVVLWHYFFVSLFPQNGPKELVACAYFALIITMFSPSFVSGVTEQLVQRSKEVIGG